MPRPSNQSLALCSYWNICTSWFQFFVSYVMYYRKLWLGAVVFTKVHGHEKSQSQQILRVLGNLQRLLRLEKRLPGTFLLDLMSHKRQNKALPVSPIYLDSIERLQVPLLNRGVVPGGAEGAMAHPDFCRSVNPISTRGDRLCPPNYYWHTRIFRPSDGPDLALF